METLVAYTLRCQREYIIKALEENNYNQKKASKQLGISQATIYRFFKRCSITRPEKVEVINEIREFIPTQPPPQVCLSQVLAIDESGHKVRKLKREELTEGLVATAFDSDSTVIISEVDFGREMVRFQNRPAAPYRVKSIKAFLDDYGMSLLEPTTGIS